MSSNVIQLNHISSNFIHIHSMLSAFMHFHPVAPMLVLTKPLNIEIFPEEIGGTMTMALPFRQNATVKIMKTNIL